MKDLREVDMILRMKIFSTHKRSTFKVVSFHWKMLEKFDFLKFFILSSPYASSKILKKNESEPVSQVKYS